MKKLLILILAFSLAGCEKEECECYWSDHFNQYVPNKAAEDAAFEGYEFSEEQLDALAAECKNWYNC